MPSPAFRSKIQSLDSCLAFSVTALCVAFLAVIVITISASVFSRFVIFTPLNFADTMSKYLMQWMAFLGVGLAIREGEHVLVDIIHHVMPSRWYRWIVISMAILLSILFATVCYNGLINAWSARNSSNPFVFGISMMIPYLSVPAGALYALVQTVISAYLLLTDITRPLNKLHLPVTGA
ncbi:Sialic acid TRAP transporter permease protein SiaT (plasmid) [Labrenzia sp. THAF191b]|nr:Sialic acid TRAP transporter permease protein SiaT [Labrenzia sp. THAF191b]QFT07854.1 Sialic acid TRAP transporter permease protein SiaT [Labrenzia sp. THAF191a]QFT19280.1 Sialic acid TRAP transporter permease protein SiaT [Labrenzia sp. THAF187b]